MSNIFGTHDQATLDQLAEVGKRATRTALMSDGHVGYIMPIGGVAAYRNEVSVVGVGFDIACGNCAIKTNRKLEDVGKDAAKIQWQLKKIADEINDTISFGVGRKNYDDKAPTDHPLFQADEWNLVPRAYRRQLFDKAVSQLGTVGSGNHYVDVFVDEDDNLWAGVHFGSRGLGHTIATAFNALGQGGQWGDRVPETEIILSLASTLGQDYWALMELAGQYAYAGREWVARRVVEILGAKKVEIVHNHHNFAWKEQVLTRREGDHYVEEMIVVRKGSTPAYPGQKGFVGGSMGDNSIILQGYTGQEQSILWHMDDALYSTVHGAGRVMSRTEAAGKRDRKTGKLKVNKETGEVVKAPKVTEKMMSDWITEKGVILRGGGVDESPHVYRRLNDVLAAQGTTIEVLHTLRPLIVVMAGHDIRDPYAD